MILQQGVSVIICCYNSAMRLPETIYHLANQKVASSIEWEIIFVNNNSKDNTSEVINQEWVKYPECTATINIINQPIQGLSHARKIGVLNSKHEIIIFCDDDNWLQSDYIQRSFDILQELPQVGVLGGVCVGVSDIEFPEWFDAVKTSYATGRQMDKSGDATARGYIWGAGQVLRKEPLVKLFNSNIKSLLTDRKANILSSGGDSEICQWFIIAGYRLWYDERLYLKHFIPRERLTREYFDRLVHGHTHAYKTLVAYSYYVQKQNRNPTIYDFIYVLRKYYLSKLGISKKEDYHTLIINEYLGLNDLGMVQSNYKAIKNIFKNIDSTN